MDDTIKHILKKFSSGKFLLTIALGTTFCILAIKEVVPADDFMKAFLVVLYAYFTKNGLNK